MTSKNRRLISRRRFLQSTAAGAAAAAIASPYVIRPANAEEEIVLATWETYSDEPWLEEFGKANNVKVAATRVGSVDEMTAKITSGALDPDLIYIDTSTIPRYFDRLAPIDVSRIPNAKNISPAIKYDKTTTIDGQIYGLPYNWGPIPMMFNTDKIKQGTDTWMTMWDPKYTGRVAVFDDSFTSFPVIAILSGAADPYKLTEDDYAKCTELLKSLRPQLKTMTTGQNDAETLFGSGEVDIGICQNPPIVVNLVKQGKPMAYSVPKEGVPSWLDCTLLTKKGSTRDIVYKFMDATMSTEWQKRFCTQNTSPGILDAKSAAALGIGDDVVKNTVMPLLDQDGLWESLKFFKVVDDADRRVQLWNDFKAGTL